MYELIEQLRERIIAASGRREFRHHQWYIEYHIKIVEKISAELCQHHPEANTELVMALVWIHDYGKMTTEGEGERRATIIEGRRLLQEIGFPDEFTAELLESVATLDGACEIDLLQSPIEVQIVSSADGCSHFVGPFYHLWWRENSDRPFEVLMDDNRRKILKDWDRKIVLPEARAAFAQRYKTLIEQSGMIPESYINDDC